MGDSILMKMLQRRNPGAYRQLKEMMASGTNPVDWMKKQYHAGKLTESQLRNVQRQARAFGYTITDKQIEDIKGSPGRAEKPCNQGGGGSWF